MYITCLYYVYSGLGLTAFALFPTRNNTALKRRLKIDPLICSLFSELVVLKIGSFLQSRTSCWLCLTLRVVNCTSSLPCAVLSVAWTPTAPTPLFFSHFFPGQQTTTKRPCITFNSPVPRFSLDSEHRLDSSFFVSLTHLTSLFRTNL